MDARTEELRRLIASLPVGSVGKKTINGKVYWYHRWYEGGKRKEKYVPAAEVDTLRSQINQRKTFEAELKQLTNASRQNPAPETRGPALTFRTNVLTGPTLRRYAEGAVGLRRRTCFQQLWDYLTGPRQDKVLILYGLRRTGKTTLLRQALLQMDAESFLRAAFVQVTPHDTLADVNADLRTLRDSGYEYVAIDETTLMEDFIEGAALFSDVFAAGGMKIILSGTDSLGFLFAQDDQLFDRCIMLHTTFIPYREFESVLGIQDIDNYIRYGGTMSMGGEHYNEFSTFATVKGADEYVDSAIARNIQHSLRLYQYGGHFRALQDLYDAGELTNAINRVVEDVNHRFAIETITRAFQSHDLRLSARNLRNDRTRPNDILDRIDTAAVTQRLTELLDIRNSDARKVCIEARHVREIEEYLALLDITDDIDVLDISDPATVHQRTVVAQPGLRWAQAGALVQSLLLDQAFATLSLVERNQVLDRILSEIAGRMMEDIILLETKLARPKLHVFKLQFAVGEFDMVVADQRAATCEIYKIKHSDQQHPSQYRHLIDPAKCADTEFRFGAITKRAVLYRGESTQEGEVSYQNVEEYLKDL